MNTPMPPCPYDKKGRHDLGALVPESDDNPLVLFCSHCGMTSRHSVQVPAPLDDLPGDAIAQLARGMDQQ